MSVSGVTNDLGNLPAMNNSFSFVEMNKCAKDLAKILVISSKEKAVSVILKAL